MHNGKRNVAGIDQVNAKQLSFEMRLLHTVVAHCIYPKTRRHDWVGKRELVVMHYMIQGIKMNLPAMMLQNIKDVANRSRTCLPYAMVFTLIFRDSLVDLEGEDYKEMVYTDYLNAGTLHKETDG